MSPIISKPLLPNEPRIVNLVREQQLTDRFLTPVLAQFELYLLALRARIDEELLPRRPVKLGKPYPLGQCLEISTAAQALFRQADSLALPIDAQSGQAAFAAFQRAGGSVRLVWGDLRGQFFQNAFQVGTLYVDVSNDTVVPTKPKVEILPFERSQLSPVRDYLHFKHIAECYWKDVVFPNHLLPELAPWFPLIHLNSLGNVRLYDLSAYMLELTCASRFGASEEVLAAPPIHPDLLELLSAALRGTDLKLPGDAASGRADALACCQRYRAKRWHASRQQHGIFLRAAHEVNRRLSGLVIQARRSDALA